ncbi:outer membrane beta-barrel protein [Olivibacter sitiensis]|uniref:outer membrane beta-barrel protein n=1 Tax=Olivibacter sitiensis TaxID=376470 RepID=UPI0004109040|nr:outer membrane beta-barrel protein [Olivibacter sitiensis]
MKKIFFIIVIVLLNLRYLGAQTWDLTYGVNVQASSPTYSVKNISSGISRDVSRTWGVGVGGFVHASPSKYFALEGGLNFQSLGSLLDYSEFGKNKVTQHSYWLQIPLKAIAKLPLRDSSYFFLGAGPYGGIGLFGTNSFKSSYSGTRTDFSFGDDGTQQRIDYGLNFTTGYRFKKGVSVNAGYTWGLADIAPGSARYEQYNRAWTFGLGYHF